MSLVRHAENELEAFGVEEDVRPHLLAAVKAFADYGHSGGPAAICADILDRLIRYKPLGPLTGADDEWIDVSLLYDGDHVVGTTYQNRRDSEVFKDEGGAYWAFGRVFRCEDGVIVTRQPDSRVPIEFPWNRPDQPEVVDD